MIYIVNKVVSNVVWAIDYRFAVFSAKWMERRNHKRKRRRDPVRRGDEVVEIEVPHPL